MVTGFFTFVTASVSQNSNLLTGGASSSRYKSKQKLDRGKKLCLQKQQLLSFQSTNLIHSLQAPVYCVALAVSSCLRH